MGCASSREALDPWAMAASGATADLSRWLMNGGMPDAVDRFRGRGSLLHVAAAGNHVDCIKLLLKNGANVDIETPDHGTPLHAAAASGASNAVTQLLASGACTSTRFHGETAAEIAQKEGFPAIASFIKLNHDTAGPEPDPDSRSTEVSKASGGLASPTSPVQNSGASLSGSQLQPPAATLTGSQLQPPAGYLPNASRLGPGGGQGAGGAGSQGAAAAQQRDRERLAAADPLQAEKTQARLAKAKQQMRHVDIASQAGGALRGSPPGSGGSAGTQGQGMQPGGGSGDIPSVQQQQPQQGASQPARVPSGEPLSEQAGAGSAAAAAGIAAASVGLPAGSHSRSSSAGLSGYQQLYNLNRGGSRPPALPLDLQQQMVGHARRPDGAESPPGAAAPSGQQASPRANGGNGDTPELAGRAPSPSMGLGLSRASPDSACGYSPSGAYALHRSQPSLGRIPSDEAILPPGEEFRDDPAAHSASHSGDNSANSSIENNLRDDPLMNYLKMVGRAAPAPPASHAIPAAAPPPPQQQPQQAQQQPLLEQQQHEEPRVSPFASAERAAPANGHAPSASPTAAAAAAAAGAAGASGFNRISPLPSGLSGPSSGLPSQPSLRPSGSGESARVAAGGSSRQLQGMGSTSRELSGLSSLSSQAIVSVDIRPWQIDFEDLQLQKKTIGEGSFGKVYVAKWHETLVAVKVLLDLEEAQQQSPEAVWTLSNPILHNLQKECALMASLRHPNVVQFMGVSANPPAMITEYCARGSLNDVLRSCQTSQNRASQMTWLRRLNMALDAAKGMLYLHRKGIIHRDLKSPNLMVESTWRVKVADFNLSKIVEDTSSGRSTIANMNPRWLAPEILNGDAATLKSDVFSWGVVMWEMLTFQCPWPHTSPWALVGKLMDGHRLPIPPRDKLPGPDNSRFAGMDAYLALMQRCWAQDPEERPDFEEIIHELRKLLEAQARAVGGQAG